VRKTSLIPGSSEILFQQGQMLDKRSVIRGKGRALAFYLFQLTCL
jgi:hypothetical protein